MLVPTLLHVSEAALAALKAATGPVLFGPRSGSKTREFSIPDMLPPGPLQQLVPMRVREVASLRPGLTETVTGAVAGIVPRWRDHVEAGEGATVAARFADGGPALVEAGRYAYLAGWGDAGLLHAAMKRLAAAAGLTTFDLPDGVRLRRRGGLTFAFNYTEPDWPLPEGAVPRLGPTVLKPGDVAMW